MRGFRTALALMTIGAACLPATAVASSSAPPPAYAVTFSRGSLTILGTSGKDDLTVTCTAGKVKINAKTPSGGPVRCSSVKRLTVSTGSGADSIRLGAVDGTDFPKLGTVKVNGGAGNDAIGGTQLADTLLGGSGDDSISGGGGADTVNGGKGTNDSATFYGTTISGNATSVIDDGVTSHFSKVERIGFNAGSSAGPCTFTAASLPVPVEEYGSPAGDTMVGSPFADDLVGNGGDDSMSGNDGSDILQPGPGNDTLDGGAGPDGLTDYLFAGPATLTDTQLSDPSDSETGTDSLASVEFVFLYENFSTGTTIDASGFSGSTELIGNTGNDAITGGSGDDAIGGGGGTDTLSGGPGTDTVLGYGSGTVTLSSTTLTTPTGTSSVSGFEDSWLSGGSGDDTLDASSFPGPSRLEGNAGNDTLKGGPADDSLYGERGNDTLLGGPGNDLLNGGSGTDTCSGGPGTNTLKSC